MSTPGAYDRLDAAILQQLRAGGGVYQGAAWDVVREYADPIRYDRCRMIDARVQTLRKQGRITYTVTDGWKVNE